MAKFEVRLKLQGLELEIKGEREEIPQLTRNISGQLAGVFTPTALIAQAKESEVTVLEHGANGTPAPESNGGKPRRKPARRRQKDHDAEDPSVAIDWVHDPAKWGAPQQSWSVADKSIWLLYVVVTGEKLRTELTGPAIATTFNKHFKQAGTVHPPNVTRELGKLKSGSPALVGENTTSEPTSWFLTHEGVKRGEQLVIDAKGQNG